MDSSQIDLDFVPLDPDYLPDKGNDSGQAISEITCRFIECMIAPPGGDKIGQDLTAGCMSETHFEPDGIFTEDIASVDKVFGTGHPGPLACNHQIPDGVIVSLRRISRRLVCVSMRPAAMNPSRYRHYGTRVWHPKIRRGPSTIPASEDGTSYWRIPRCLDGIRGRRFW